MALISCASKENTDVAIVEKKIYDVNIKSKAEKNAGGLVIFGKPKVEDHFSADNILWKATSKTLGFMPVASADYQGGIYVTDWYGNDKEKIKIVVNFYSRELKVTSIDVRSFKKICTGEKCEEIELKNEFSNKVKESIIRKAIEYNVEKEKSKKN